MTGIVLVVIVAGLIVFFLYPQGLLGNAAPTQNVASGADVRSGMPFSQAIELFGAALIVMLILLLLWYLWELRRQLDETASIVPLLNVLQRMLGGIVTVPQSPGLREAQLAELEGEHGTIPGVLFMLISKISELQRKVVALETFVGYETLPPPPPPSRGDVPPSPAFGKAQNHRQPQASPDDWQKAVENDYNRLFLGVTADAFVEFAERHRVLSASIAGQHGFALTDERPSDAKFWLVEDPQLGAAIVFPGQKLFEALGSFSTDGGVRLRQILGDIFVIGQGHRFEVEAAQVDRSNQEGEFPIKHLGRLSLPIRNLR